MQGLPILEQDLGIGGNSCTGNGSSFPGGEATATGSSGGTGWGLGGSGPVLKTQTIVSYVLCCFTPFLMCFRQREVPAGIGVAHSALATRRVNSSCPKKEAQMSNGDMMLVAPLFTHNQRR